MNLLNDIRILLTRWSTAFVLLGVLAVAMAGATLIEAGIFFSLDALMCVSVLSSIQVQGLQETGNYAL